MNPVDGARSGYERKRHVEQEVVAGVGEQRRVQQRVVADVDAGDASSASGSRRRRIRPGRSAPRRCAARAAAGGRPSCAACRRSSGGSSRTQSCSTRELVGPRNGGRRVGELGARRVGVERGDRDQERPFALGDGHAPRGHRAAVAHPLDRQIQGLLGGAGLDEVRVQGVRLLAGHGRARREQGLGDRLPAEDAVEAAGLADHPEAVAAPRLELERSAAGRRARRGAPFERPSRPRIDGSASRAHGQMASTPTRPSGAATRPCGTMRRVRGCRRC